MVERAQKTTPVRLSDDAIRWARIASGYTGESMAEYVSRIVAERAVQDTERLHTEATGGGKAEKSAPHPKVKGETIVPGTQPAPRPKAKKKGPGQ